MSITNGPKIEPAYMSIADLGRTTISLTPTSKDPKVFKLDLGCDGRKEAISMETNANETVDQFIGRLRGCLKALWQAERTMAKEVKK